jgi:hypothetical protein
MASSLASTTTASPTPAFTLPNLTHFTSIKLEGPNYLSWTTQLAHILKTHNLMGIVDGFEPCPPQFLPGDDGKEVLNPAYSIWQKKDQYVLSWINVHLSESVLSTRPPNFSASLDFFGNQICLFHSISCLTFEALASNSQAGLQVLF